jgi:hypothetical protein
MKCIKCNGSGKRLMKTGNIGICLRCLGSREVDPQDLNDRKFYRNIKRTGGLTWEKSK